jgi:transposase
MFEDELMDIQDNKDRYVIRRNPVRKQEITANRQQRIAVIEKMIMASNQYLQEHPRGKTDTQIQRITAKIKSYKFTRILKLVTADRHLSTVINTKELNKLNSLDGCYAMKTNLDKQAVSASIIHDRYKDLAHVEYAFKNIKTEQLQVRPIYLRREDRTRAHVFICSLAYKVIKYLRDSCKDLGLTLDEVLENLKAISYIIYDVNGVEVKQLPGTLNRQQASILGVLDIQLPTML